MTNINPLGDCFHLKLSSNFKEKSLYHKQRRKPIRRNPPRFNSFKALRKRGPKVSELTDLRNHLPKLVTESLEGRCPLALVVELTKDRFVGLLLSDLFVHTGVSPSPSLVHWVTESRRRRQLQSNCKKVQKQLDFIIKERTQDASYQNS